MAQVGSRLASKAYQEDLALVAQGSPDWSVFDNSTIAVSGATGMIGTFLIDVLMQKNLEHDIDCHILALGRDEEKARARLMGGQEIIDDENRKSRKQGVRPLGRKQKRREG
jgi:NADPH:quinone reductase-like Zn-dependent oxidoreductase